MANTHNIEMQQSCLYCDFSIYRGHKQIKRTGSSKIRYSQINVPHNNEITVRHSGIICADSTVRLWSITDFTERSEEQFLVHMVKDLKYGFEIASRGTSHLN